MDTPVRIIYYLNQFFGQAGGEDKAGMEPILREEAVGPAAVFDGMARDWGSVVGTVVCGDNYFNENKPEALKRILEMLKQTGAELLVAGPAFNAGRYGMACAELCREAAALLGIPAVTGMYRENPGVDACKKDIYIIETGDSAAGMKSVLSKMAGFAPKLLRQLPIGTPEEEGYIPKGIRKTVFSEKNGSARAVEMLLARLRGEAFETEMPMADFDRVDPAPPVQNLASATIALVSSGGIVPKGNPDRIESASATKFGRYSLAGLDTLDASSYETIHGGYDPVYANLDPNRVVPLDVLREMERSGRIGKVHEYYYATTGTGTSVANAVQFGKEIGAMLQQEKVDAVLLVST